MKATYFYRRCSLLMVVSILGLVGCFSASVSAQRTEYRGFWVETTTIGLNNHNDIVATVNRAKSAKTNAIFAQVRRRGDAWYITPFEPKASTIAAGFDPLADLIQTAHVEGIEVHAYVVMSTIHSSSATPPAITLPASPLHVFNQHGGYNAATRTIDPGPNNWLTRTLLPDTANNTTFQGHRFGTDFWLDFGHPDAAAYTVNVLMHLVNNYDIDGLHVDGIRYPDFTAAGQSATTGANIGYNDTSVARFNTRYNRTGTPTPDDAQWTQWRRDQVTNVVRRLYLNVMKVKPQVKVSGSFHAAGTGPTKEAQWTSTDAYWRVYQDWRAWTEEGIVDLAIPLNAKREHLSADATQFRAWNEWTRNHQYNRSALIGLGTFMNPIEGTLRQVRTSLQSSSTTFNSTQGVVFSSMGQSNSVATNGVTTAAMVNPFGLPPSVTPVRNFAEFASAVVTSRSTTGTVRFEDTTVNPVPIFAQNATIPVHPWKLAPTTGHLMGFARRLDNTVLDTATVTITNLDTDAIRTTTTDGGGFYGAVDLEPGDYQVRAELGTTTLYVCSATVTAGYVTTADVSSTSTAPPTTTSLVTPAEPDGANGWYITPPTVSLSAVSGCAALDRTEVSFDEGETWQTYTGPVTITQEGVTTMQYRSVDVTGNIEPAHSLTFMVDLSGPTVQLTANPTTIWPPNGQMVNVSLFGTGADSGGLSQVRYVVVDEYLGSYAVEPRVLTGNSANWVDTLPVEAWRNGRDRDGRVYTVTAIVTDVAGRTSSASVNIVVPHDRRRE